MAYSNRLQLKKSGKLLGRTVELDPGDANAQTALCIAALRDNDPAAAQGPLEKAVVLQPHNPFALRTLGQLLLMRNNPEAALPYLRAAATVAPEDPIHLFTYAQTLLAIEGESRAAEGDGLFQRALQLAPVGELAEKIKAQQRQLAARVMRANAKGEPRRDAVTYLRGALEAYLALDLEAQKQLLVEVAARRPEGPGDQRSAADPPPAPLPRRQHRFCPAGGLHPLRGGTVAAAWGGCGH